MGVYNHLINPGKGKETSMKKIILIAAGAVLALLMAAAGILLYVWHRYEMPQIVGDTVESERYDLEEISWRWFSQYFDQFDGWLVPYDYRVVNARIENMEILTDLEMPCIQIDYEIYTAGSGSGIVQALDLSDTDTRRVYTGQMVLCWEPDEDDIYRITEKMSPVQYQMSTPEFQEERQKPQTKHFEMKTDEPMTYYIRDGVLYVTYDSGENFIEVPDGYEKVCSQSNGTYNELLPYNSYVITEEFTGFVAGHSLLYSTDRGETWNESRIRQSGYAANPFLSVTDSGYYVTMAADRSLGSDYYATYYSEDLKNWISITLPDCFCTNLTCSFWTKDGRGYYAKDESMMATLDGGKTFQDIVIPEAEEITERLGFNPFDTVEKMYEEDGILYAVVGQGDDGDYVKDGKLREALYQSEDGSTFSFVEVISDDTPEAAG